MGIGISLRTREGGCRTPETFSSPKIYPAPVGAGRQGGLAAGRGTPFTRSGNFSAGKMGLPPRIMRAHMRHQGGPGVHGYRTRAQFPCNDLAGDWICPVFLIICGAEKVLCSGSGSLQEMVPKSQTFGILAYPGRKIVRHQGGPGGGCLLMR